MHPTTKPEPLSRPITLAGEHLLLDPAGVLVWPRLSLLAVADLHLEKGSACAGAGQLVPPWDSRQTLQRLAMLQQRYQPRVVLAVGDSFHDDGGPGRLGAEDAALLVRMARDSAFVWIRGNHDPSPQAALPGTAAASWEQAGLVFRHQSAGAGTGEVSGHFHPKARVATRVGDIVRPCFITDGTRLLLPAFGAYTGGLDVRQPAIAALFPGGAEVFMLGRDRLFGFTIGGPAAQMLARAAEPHNFC